MPLDLSEMLDDDWADCKGFGNLFTCATRSLGVSGAALPVLGPFNTRPILGARHSTRESVSWNHHQFGWQSSLVHDSACKVDQADPKYAVNMARDTTYKGYLYQSGTWSPQSSVVCSVW